MRGKAHFGQYKHRWDTVSLAAYCWVPNAFPHFPAPEVGPRTLLDFVAGDASFVLEALLALAGYLDAKYHDKAVHDRTESRANRRRTDFNGQILAALAVPVGGTDALLCRSRVWPQLRRRLRLSPEDRKARGAIRPRIGLDLSSRHKRGLHMVR